MAQRKRELIRRSLEQEHIHLGLLEEAIKGLADVKAGKTLSLAKITSRHGR